STVIKRQSSSSSVPTLGIRRRRLQHLCLDKAYISAQEEQELIKRGYVLHIPYKRKRGEKEKDVKGETQPSLSHKKHSAKRWVVERTNSWHNRFRNYLPDMKRR
ncbi:MAG: hypothetical protein M3Q77_01025, partial [Thermoproteota archaeon]|nr:hypothetical protein [Thermoproteota archaeon]